jgi:hypothetical protein
MPDTSADEVQQIQAMLTRERLAVDLCDGKRTAFLTHVGAPPRLTPGPWIAHRQLVMALALANLAPNQRASLARAVVVEWGREFGVGRMVLSAVASGLPLGGSSLSMRPRITGGGGQPHILYTWALGPRATPIRCDWLLLRAQPEWACNAAPRALGVRGLETLAQLGGSVLLLVPSAVAARQVADSVGGALALDAHPRFLPFLDEHDPEAKIVLWPHDAIAADSLDRRHSIGPRRAAGLIGPRRAAGLIGPRRALGFDRATSSPGFSTAVLIGAPEVVRQETMRWAVLHPGVEVVDAACPGRMNRKALALYWEACGRPKVLLRGDPEWAAEAQPWLESIGAVVEAHSEATQLGLF